MERPILMSAPMVRAILAGEKTQTRRVVKSPSTKHQDVVFVFDDINNVWWPFFSDDGESSVTDDGMEAPIECPYGKPGDRLWVREAWRAWGGTVRHVDYRATTDVPRPADGWKPSIHMRRADSRILLEVTGVRVELLQDISEQDARSEGAESADYATGRKCILEPDKGSYRLHYRSIWEEINGAGSWDLNPWVWVVEFKRVA